jgi:site-specific DNA recombinase
MVAFFSCIVGRHVVEFCSLPNGSERKVESMRARRTNKAIVNRMTISYSRVSTESQASEGISIDAQEARIAAYCAAMGWPLSEVIRDAGCSAKTLKRPGIGKILQWVREGSVERIVVARLDRATRSVSDLNHLIQLCGKHDTALVSIAEVLDTASAGGRLVCNLLAVVAQWTREQIGENTANALAHKRQQRQAYGRTPFGFIRQDKAIVPHPQEQVVKAEAIRMDRAGASFREIGAMLTERTGRFWGPSSTRAMLRSKMVTEAA